MTSTTSTFTPPTTAPAGNASESTNLPSTTAQRPSRTWLAASIAAATATLQACGGGGEESPTTSSLVSAPDVSAEAARVGTRASGATASGTTVPAATQTVVVPVNTYRNFVTPRDDNDASRFLQQAQFSASDADIASIRELGYAGWLNRAMSVAPGQSSWDWLVQRGYGVADSRSFHFTPYQTDFAVWHQLIKAPDAVRQRVALCLSEIFAVSTKGVDYFWLSQIMTSWWDTLSAGALGNFRDLLENIALHPAMGLYLNSRGSQKENAAGRQPDENFAREVMQLMTIGLIKLNADGTPVVSGGVPVETYTQDDVIGLARVFTGYNFNTSTKAASYVNGLSVPHMDYTRLPMVLSAGLHSTLEKKFLGTTIAAGTDGNAARKTALDTLFNHPNVGPFIGRQLIQRLVTSNPSSGYVGRVAKAFADNGKGVRGDLAAVIAAILLDDEARDPAGVASNTFGHLREPMVRLVQWGRTFGLESARGSWKLYDQSDLTKLGQSPLRSPSIFNFFRPGYVPPGGGVAAAGMVAPEFQIVNESSVSGYINYFHTVLRNGIYVGAPDVPQITGNGTDGFDIVASYTKELPLAANATALVARLNLVLAAGQLSVATCGLISSALNATAVSATSNDATKLNRIAAGVLMVMSSYEYLVQK